MIQMLFASAVTRPSQVKSSSQAIRSTATAPEYHPECTGQQEPPHDFYGQPYAPPGQPYTSSASYQAQQASYQQ